jgi:hypothetical protein
MPRIFSKSRLKLPPSGIPDNAPPINTVPATQTTPVGTAKQFSDTNGNQVKVGDVDSPIVTAVVSTTNGTIEVIPNPATLIWNNITASVSCTGSVVNVNRALNGMYLRPVAGYNGTATITLRTSDGYNIDIDSFDVTVGVGTPPAPAPQPPVNTVPGAKTTAYQTALNLASANISVYDPDSTSLTTTLTMQGGTVNVSAAGGATVTGNSTNLVTISGTQAQINAALATVVYTPSTGFVGAGQIQMSTSDGSLVDIDTIDITVQAAAGAPVITAPVGRSGGNMTFSVANGYPISVSDPNSSTLTVTLTAGNGKLKAVDIGTVPLADGFPSKIIYGFWLYWSSLRITAISQNFNIIGLFHFRNSGNGMDGGSASWPTPGNPTAAEVKTVVDRGQKIFVVVGGVGYSFFYSTRAQSDALLAALIPFINGLGGAAYIHGVDFNNWYTDITGLDYATELVYLAQQLKATFGVKFAIVFPVKNNAAYNRNLMKAMSDANYSGTSLLTWVNPQYTDNVAYKTAGVVKGEIDTWVNTPLAETKVMMGLSSNYNMTTNSLTLAECTREWDAAYAAHPNLRGVGCYSIDTDAAISYAFANAFKARFDTAMQTGASITNNNTRQITIYGTIAQCNAALDGLTYTIDGSGSGDSIQITANDGALTDSEVITLLYPA